MSLIKRKRPSPAMIVAVAALSFAMVGTAVAGTNVASKLTKSKVKSIAKKQADKELKANVTGSHVNTADNATSLGGVPAGSYLQSSGVRADGFASSADIDDFTAAAFTPIAAKTFTAPSAGFVYVTASLSAEDDITFAGQGNLFFKLAIDGTATNTDNFYHQLSTNGAEAGAGGETGAITDVLPVAAGSHTVALQARESGSGSFILGRDLSLLFVPTGSSSPIPQAPVSGGANAGASAQH